MCHYVQYEEVEVLKKNSKIFVDSVKIIDWNQFKTKSYILGGGGGVSQPII